MHQSTTQTQTSNTFRITTNYITRRTQVELITTNPQGIKIIVGIMLPTTTGFKLLSRDLTPQAIEGPTPDGLMAWNYGVQAKEAI